MSAIVESESRVNDLKRTVEGKLTKTMEWSDNIISNIHLRPLEETDDIFKFTLSGLNVSLANAVRRTIQDEIPVYYRKGLCCISDSLLEEDFHSLNNGYAVNNEDLEFPVIIYEKAINLKTTPDRLLEVLFDKFAPGVLPWWEQCYLNNLIGALKLPIHVLPDDINVFYTFDGYETARLQHYTCGVNAKESIASHRQRYFNS